MRRIARGALGLLAVAGLTATAWGHGNMGHGMASSKAGPLSASQCWIRQLPAPAPSGGFLIIHNSGASTAVLQSVHSPDYGQAMMHQTTEAAGMSTMSPVRDLKIPAGGELAFKPGSYHLMLEQPRAGLKVGDTVQMQFKLAGGGEFSAACEVRPANAMPGMQGMSGMKGMPGMEGMSGHGMH